MDKKILTTHQKNHLCRLCRKIKPVIDYSENKDAQTAIGTYLQKISGETFNVTDFDNLCDECYTTVSFTKDLPLY